MKTNVRQHLRRTKSGITGVIRHARGSRVRDTSEIEAMHELHARDGKYIVEAVGYDKDKDKYITRKETINTKTNIIFQKAKTPEAIKRKYERFWGGQVKVLRVYKA